MCGRRLFASWRVEGSSPLVYLVDLVYFVYLVYLVYLVYFVYLVLPSNRNTSYWSLVIRYQLLVTNN
jgi:hypothetical protein